MKYTAFLLFSALASATAFTPVTTPAPSVPTALSAKKSNLDPKFKSGGGEKKSFFATVFDMDLWKERSDSNDYGGRTKKVEWSAKGLGKIQEGKSYVPAGLTAAQYNAQRSKERSAKEKNYQKNVAKAGKFEDYTDFYLKRGTDQNGSWLKAANRGHKMVKTKYDWDGGDGTPLKDMKQFESGVKKGKAAGKNGKFMFGKK